MQKLIPVFFLLTLFCDVANGQSSNAFPVASSPESAGFSSDRLKRIDVFLETAVREQRTPGVVALIIRDGKIVYHKAVGYSDSNEKTR